MHKTQFKSFYNLFIHKTVILLLLIRFLQIVSDFLWRENAEHTLCINHTDFNVVWGHLPLITLPKMGLLSAAA